MYESEIVVLEKYVWWDSQIHQQPDESIENFLLGGGSCSGGSCGGAGGCSGSGGCGSCGGGSCS